MATHGFDDSMIITGPTGCGKSALALQLAGSLNAEIICMDSMTLYRGMDIGTAKATAAEQAVVRHHLIDCVEPWESASVAWWLAEAEKCCVDIRNRGKVPMFVGGTPFYLMAILFGLFEAPPANEAIRRKLDDEAVQIGLPAMHQRLTSVDPLAASRIHPNDQRRIVRALEVFESTGQPISSFQGTWNTANYSNETKARPVKAIRLDWPREELYSRIDRRVLSMFRDDPENNWVQECKALVRRCEEAGQTLSREAEKAIGYREILATQFAEQQIEEQIPVIAMRTRQFAKRQLTWFRRLTQIPVVDMSQPDAKELAIEILTGG